MWRFYLCILKGIKKTLMYCSILIFQQDREFHVSTVRSLLTSSLTSLFSSLIIVIKFHLKKKIMGKEGFQWNFSEEITWMLHCIDSKSININQYVQVNWCCTSWKLLFIHTFGLPRDQLISACQVSNTAPQCTMAFPSGWARGGFDVEWK